MTTEILVQLQSFYKEQESELFDHIMEKTPLNLEFYYLSWSRGVIRESLALFDGVLLKDTEAIEWIKECLVEECLVSPDSDVQKGVYWTNYIIREPLEGLEDLCSRIDHLGIRNEKELTWFIFLVNAFSHGDFTCFPHYHTWVKDFVNLLKPTLIIAQTPSEIYRTYGDLDLSDFDMESKFLFDWVYLIDYYLSKLTTFYVSG